MRGTRRRWAMVPAGAADVYGRVWTDPRKMSPWVVLIDAPRDRGRSGRRPWRIVFRRGAEEWSWPVPTHTRLVELGDELLRTYLERARSR